MYVGIDVTDFGTVKISPSRDNPGMVRLAFEDKVMGKGTIHVDLDYDEAKSLEDAIELVRSRL